MLDILEEFDVSAIEGKYQEEERLKKKIVEMIEEAEATGRAEDERFGRNSRGDERPEELGRRRDRYALRKSILIERIGPGRRRDK